MPDGWSFLIDENLEPQIAEYLRNESMSAEHVRDALRAGADVLRSVVDRNDPPIRPPVSTSR